MHLQEGVYHTVMYWSYLFIISLETNLRNINGMWIVSNMKLICHKYLLIPVWIKTGGLANVSSKRFYFIKLSITTQQDYYCQRCGTLLHSYCTITYTKVTVLLLWSSSNATLEYPRRYSNKVSVWELHGNSRVTSQDQPCYFSVGTSAVTV